MRHLSCIVAVSLLLAASSAAAAAAREPLPTWGIGLRVAPYKPAIGGPAERQYYNSFFDKGQHVLWQLQADRFFADFYGPFGVFVRSGRWSVTKANRVCRDADGAIIDCTSGDIVAGGASKGNGSSTLSIIPVTIGLEYRAAILQRGFGIPLVPYANVAYDYFFWSASSEGGGGNDEGSGATAGLEGTVGLALGLDWISTGADRAVFLDSYLFVEATKIWGSGFGNPDKLDMSAQHFALGFAFEFE